MGDRIVDQQQAIFTDIRPPQGRGALTIIRLQFAGQSPPLRPAECDVATAVLGNILFEAMRQSQMVGQSDRQQQSGIGYQSAVVEERLSFFDDPIPGNSALDRLANASYQIIIEGTSYRERLSPHRALLNNEGGD